MVSVKISSILFIVMISGVMFSVVFGVFNSCAFLTFTRHLISASNC